MDSNLPLIIRFTTWLRDNPYGMPSCLPNLLIKLDDNSEHPCRRNILAAHSRYFNILLNLDPDEKNYRVKDVSKEVFNIFLDFCYKRTITNITIENYYEVEQFADKYRCDLFLSALRRLVLTVGAGGIIVYMPLKRICSKKAK